MRVRVLHVTPSLVPYGAERTVASLALGTDRARFETSVASLFGEHPESLGPLLERSGLQVHYLNKRAGLDVRMLGKLTRLIDEFKPHVVHTSNYVLRYTLLPAIRRNVPVQVHTLQNIAEREVDLAGRLLQRWAFRQRVHPVSIAHEVSASYKRVYGLPRPRLIPNAVDVERYAEAKNHRDRWRLKEGFRPEDFLYVCVARLDSQKNHTALLDAFASGPAKIPAAKLLLAGDGPLKHQLEEHVRNLKLADRVFFLGCRDDVPQLLGASDVFALASLWEGNPLSVMEAMAAGLPVVVTTVGGVPELLEDGQQGRLLAPGDVQSLASALVALAHDQAACRAMGDAARERARERFDQCAMIRAYEDLYTELLGASSKIARFDSGAGKSKAPQAAKGPGNELRSAQKSSVKIAFVLTRADAIGGATVHVRDLARGLQDMGHHATVLIGGRGEVLEDLDRNRIPYQTLRWLGRPIHPIKDAFAVAELRRALIQLKPDLVCAHTAKAGLVGRLAASLAGIPALYTPHGWSIGDRISTTHAWPFRVAERIAAPFSKSIINVSEAERSLARGYRIADDSKLALIYNGVPDVETTLRADAGISPPRVLMVARFDSPKDPLSVIRASANLRDLPWSLEFLGSGPGRRPAERLTHQLGVAPRTTFTDGGDVASRLAAAQVFVLSSRSEGFPLSILEAMRAGLPVVASDVGGVREAVIDGETGFVVKPGDPQALADALRLLIENGALRRKFGAAGRRRYELHFTFEHMLRQTVALYESVLSGPLQVGLTEEAVSGRR